MRVRYSRRPPVQLDKVSPDPGVAEPQRPGVKILESRSAGGCRGTALSERTTVGFIAMEPYVCVYIYIYIYIYTNIYMYCSNYQTMADNLFKHIVIHTITIIIIIIIIIII